MSIFDAFFSGWQLRSSTPNFEEGEEITVTLTNYDEQEGSMYARVGDSKIYIDDGFSSDDIGKQVQVKVSEFETTDHVGRAEVLQVVGETGF